MRMNDNKLNISRKELKKINFETTVTRKTIVKKIRKNSKSYKRRNRRKRSKKAYINMLKNKRTIQGTEELCNSVQQFSVIDIDMTPMCNLNQLPDEVTEWQKLDQIAYWKSKAITLEIENKMLKQHLRHFYTQQIDFYGKSQDWQKISAAEDSTEIPQSSTSITNHEVSHKVLPKEPIGKNRLEEMQKIYGERAPKIMGMETALELNYERLLEEESRIFWPNLPLKL
ncbi:hypothetical protein ABEB36_014272 [Hypothenemus hampei]|uniref:Uncharacterized protein n=1 Tax=Hypothenemus hampei TaxID=57062 RepID=A0ABD1E427_HYPHA